MNKKIGDEKLKFNLFIFIIANLTEILIISIWYYWTTNLVMKTNRLFFAALVFHPHSHALCIWKKKLMKGKVCVFNLKHIKYIQRNKESESEENQKFESSLNSSRPTKHRWSTATTTTTINWLDFGFYQYLDSIFSVFFP